LASDLKKNHFGYDHEKYRPAHFRSTHQTTFGPKSGKAEFNSDLKDGLRRHHFVFGDQKVDYRSVTQSEFYPKSGVGNGGAGADMGEVIFGKSNFSIATDPRAKTVLSSTQAAYTEKKGAQRAKATIDAHKSNLQLSRTRSTPMISEARRQFESKKANPSDLQKDTMNNLRRNHWQIGQNDTTSKHFMSSTQVNFTSKNSQSARGQLNDSNRKDLQRTHFQLGCDKEKMVSQTRATHSKEIGTTYAKSAELTALKANLRRNHFDFGDNSKAYFTTTQKGTFVWKQPVAEN